MFWPWFFLQRYSLNSQSFNSDSSYQFPSLVLVQNLFRTVQLCMYLWEVIYRGWLLKVVIYLFYDNYNQATNSPIYLFGAHAQLECSCDFKSLNLKTEQLFVFKIKQSRNMNVLSNLDQIANLIIRPARYHYKLSDLGNRTFQIGQKDVIRKDFDIKNDRGLTIKGSIYSTKQYQEVEHILIYLHCNSGCRVQGLTYLKKAIVSGFAYVVFDFTGSGVSEGKYVSLGHYETQDLQIVYNYVRKSINPAAKVILWGRSMGAVTALNFLLKGKHEVSMGIFDSPFKSLKELFIQTGKEKTSFPQIILEVAYRYIKPIVLEKADFDIESVNIMMEGNNIKTPGIFIASKNDSLVPFRQIDQIFKAYAGDKQLFFIEQEHNQARNKTTVQKVFDAIGKNIAHEGRQKIKKQNTVTYLSQLADRKELSRKKLSLTIKSLSQRQLAPAKISLQEPVVKAKHTQKRQQSLTPILQKKPISCLLPSKKSLRQLEQDNEQQQQHTHPQTLNANRSESKLRVKRKPLIIKNFFNESNQEAKNNTSLSSGRQNVIKFKNKLLQQNREQVVSTKLNHPHTSKQPVKPPKVKQNLKQSAIAGSSIQMIKLEQLIDHDPSEPLLLRNDKSKSRNRNLNVNVKKGNKIQTNKSDVQVTKSHIRNYEDQREEQNPPFTTHRQVKCTQRVLQKIIQKQQKKLLILNVTKKNTQKETTLEAPKQRKTMQHVAAKSPLYVELRGSKKFRNSLEGKYKSQVHKS